MSSSSDPKQIPDLQTGSVVNAADYVVVRQGIYDKKFQVSQLTASVTNDCLKISKNLSDINNAAASRLNLGLGSASTKNVGEDAGEVVILDDQARLPSVDGSQLRNLPSAVSPQAAGAGLFILNNAFQVNPDNQTIEIFNNALRLRGFTGPLLDNLSGLKQNANGSISIKVDGVTTTINSNGELVSVGGGSSGGGSSGGSGGSSGNTVAGVYIQTGTAGVNVGQRHTDRSTVPFSTTYTDVYPPTGKLMTDFIGGQVSQAYWQGGGVLGADDEMFAYYENRGSFLRVYHYYTDAFGLYVYLTSVRYTFFWKEALNLPSGSGTSMPGQVEFANGELVWSRTSLQIGTSGKPPLQYITPPTGYTVADLKQFNLNQKQFTPAPGASGNGLEDDTIRCTWVKDIPNNRIAVQFEYLDESIGDGDNINPYYMGQATYYWNAIYMKAGSANGSSGSVITGVTLQTGELGNAGSTVEVITADQTYTDIYPPPGLTMEDFIQCIITDRTVPYPNVIDRTVTRSYEKRSDCVRIINYYRNREGTTYWGKNVLYTIFWKASGTSGGSSGSGSGVMYTKYEYNGYPTAPVKIFPPTGKTADDYLGAVLTYVATSGAEYPNGTASIFFKAMSDHVSMFYPILSPYYWQSTVHHHLKYTLLWKD